MVKQGLLNRRPNMNQVNRLNNRDLLEDDDFDEPVAMSSFTKSKVDDDDDKFRNRSEPEFIDFMPSKKPEPSITPTRTDKSPSPFNTPPSSRDMPQNKSKSPINTISPKPQSNQIEKTPQKPQSITPSKQGANEKGKVDSKSQTPIVTPSKQQPGTPNKEIKTNFIEDTRNQQTKQAPQKSDGEAIRSQKQKNAPVISFQRDDKIRAIEIRNQKNVKIAYVTRNHPNFYGQGEKYQDYEFPMNVSSVYQKPKTKAHMDITFERIENAYSAELVTVADPRDINVGENRNYNFASALAALTDNPLVISRLVEDQKINKDGFYYVRLYIDGVWRYEVVDDFLAFQSEKHLHIGPLQDFRSKKTKSSQKTEVWSSIVEKALSKVYGSYEDINQNTHLNNQVKAGSILDFLSTLTGAPTSEFPLDPAIEEEFVKELSQLNPQNIVVFSLRDQAGNSEVFRSKLCLPSEYGYTLLQFNQQKKELKLRNTWGWLKEPKHIQILKQISDDGQFTISLKDALQYFDTATISRFQSEYWTISHSVRQVEDSFSVYQINVSEKTKFYLNYSQVDSRHFRNNIKEKYSYSFGRLLLFDDQNMIASNQGAQKEISVRLEVNEGRYFVVVCVDWNQQPLESIITYYGSSDVELKRVEYDPYMFAKLLGPHVTKYGEKRNLPPNSPAFNKSILEQVWIGVEEKLLAISWTNTSQNQIQYKRTIKNIQKRDKLIPIGFVNQADASDSKKWTAKRINLIKSDSWLNGNEIDMTLQASQQYIALFKHNGDKSLVKELGL